MATIEQSVTLLRRNKRALVEAINQLGFADVDETTRVSLFPQLIRWANGLLDVNVACRRKSDGKHFYFTIDEWESLSATEQSTMLLRGVRLRAMSYSIIIALAPCGSMYWAGQSAANLNTGYTYAFRTCEDIRADTEAIVTFFTGKTLNNVEGSPAASAAINYRAFTEEQDGIEDETKWALPSVKLALIMYHYKLQVNAVLEKVGGTAISTGGHWTCNSYNAADAYIQNMGVGSTYNSTKSSTNGVVRPIAVE
jgi:hypothetical protein